MNVRLALYQFSLPAARQDSTLMLPNVSPYDRLPEIVRVATVLKITGLSRSTLWRRIRAGEFPQPFKLGGPSSRAVGWLMDDIVQWVRSRSRSN